jgi:hypothetical protein
MKYMKEWYIRPENIKAVIKRFQEGTEPMDGITQLGRWTIPGIGKGYVLYETDDPIALAKLNLYWSDLTDDKLVPVIDDEEAAKSLGG